MGKVLSFPKEKARRVTSLRQSEARRLFYSFSLFSVIAMAVIFTEKINNMSRPQYIFAVNYDKNEKLNRAVASQDNVEFIENIRWGQELINKINQAESDRQPAALGTRPDALDQLRFGELAGKYRMTVALENQKISEIEYVESDRANETPIHVRNREQFLTENKGLLSIAFEKVQTDSRSAQSEIYKLLNQKGESVGKAAFQLDEKGRFLSLKVGE